ncbi:hypothetical protein [Ekhidna sp.]|uniref:hypothetical protein n=1 Tax=Ekhidna sp. TaxID=2608089 RepID=UPI003298269F
MKTSNILFALVILLSAACNTKTSGDDHGHEHGTEGGHSHDEATHDHADQEEFKVDGDASAELALTTEAKIEAIENQKGQVEVTVPAGKGVEYKFYLDQYEKLIYEWSANVSLHSDFHGEPLDYEQTKYFESYVISRATKMKGTATMPFAGSHGWYWKNNSANDVVVTLITEGKYKVIGLK